MKFLLKKKKQKTKQQQQKTQTQTNKTPQMKKKKQPHKLNPLHAKPNKQNHNLQIWNLKLSLSFCKKVSLNLIEHWSHIYDQMFCCVFKHIPHYWASSCNYELV